MSTPYVETYAISHVDNPCLDCALSSRAPGANAWSYAPSLEAKANYSNIRSVGLNLHLVVAMFVHNAHVNYGHPPSHR